MNQMSVSTEAIFLNRTYLAVSTDIVPLPNLDTQATGFSLGEARATVPQSMMCQIAPSKSYSAWTIHCAKVQNTCLMLLMSHKRKHAGSCEKGLNEILEGVKEIAQDDWEEILGDEEI